jgi:hypothetical protein
MMKEQQQQQQQHPMVSVPEALRIVLRKTACRSWMRKIHSNNSNHSHQEQDDDDETMTWLSLQELVMGQ